MALTTKSSIILRTSRVMAHKFDFDHLVFSGVNCESRAIVNSVSRFKSYISLMIEIRFENALFFCFVSFAVLFLFFLHEVLTR